MVTSIDGRRSSIKIVHDILSMCNKGAPKKTAIMYGAKINHGQLRRYVTLLAFKDFIQQDDEGRYNITPVGQQTLKRVSRAIKTLRRLRQELGLNPVVNGD